MNIDKDIERCKNLIGYVGCELREIEANSISNVLSELEKYKQYYEEQNEVNKKFVSKDKFDEVNAELETYKKIAEKLAEELSKYIWLNDKDAIIKIYREKV